MKQAVCETTTLGAYHEGVGGHAEDPGRNPKPGGEGVGDEPQHQAGPPHPRGDRPKCGERLGISISVHPAAFYISMGFRWRRARGATARMSGLGLHEGSSTLLLFVAARGQFIAQRRLAHACVCVRARAFAYEYEIRAKYARTGCAERAVRLCTRACKGV